VDRERLAYVIGLAIGDGNLSNPNGRATRLRITCDTRYPKLLRRIQTAIQGLLPDNKVGIIYRAKSYVDVSCYSNQWESWLGWRVGRGSKYRQRVTIPQWIQKGRLTTISCLRGLIETDGSIYRDRGYLMVSFTTMIPRLAVDVSTLITKLGFKPHTYKTHEAKKVKHVVRLSRNVKQFIGLLGLTKD